MADTSTKWGITEPSAARTDAADVPLYVRNVVAALEAKGVQYGQGTLAARPAFGVQGRVYVATDQTPVAAYWDTGAAWNQIGALAAGAVGTTQLADGSVTLVKLATDSVDGTKIVDGSVTTAEIADGTITGTDIAAALKPSGGAGAGTEALRALGTAVGTAATGTHKTQHQSGGADQILVTMDMLEALVQNAMWQTGDIKWVGYNVVAGSEPTGWLLGDGRAVSRVTYAALFAKYGVTHGAGDGVNTFNLPDIRGRGIIGIGTGTGLTARSIGQKGGEEAHVITIAEMASHNHGGATGGSGPTTDTQGSHLHTFSNGASLAVAIGSTDGTSGLVWGTAGGAVGYSSGTQASGSHSQNVPNQTQSVSSQGGDTAHNNMQPWIALTPLVKT